MTGVNLIPASRMRATMFKQRRRLWVRSGLAYAAVLLCTFVVCHGQLARGDEGLEPAVAQVAARINQGYTALQTGREQLKHALQTLRINRVLTDRPDWSVLLRLLARNLQDELVLSRIELQPIRGAMSLDGSTPAAAGPSGFTLTVTGHGRSQSCISALALRLEQMGLFAKVAVETKRVPFLSGQAVSFVLTCSIHEAQDE